MSDLETAVERISDEDLARRVAASPTGLARDEEAELYRRFAPRVRLYGLRHLRDAAAAQDLVQEVLLVAIRRLRAGEVKAPQQIGSFILGTSRVLAMSLGRGARQRELLEAQFAREAAACGPMPATHLDQGRVDECLKALAERDRTVLVLTFYAERTTQQIGNELGVSPGAVRVVRHRAIERLRDCVLRGRPA
jgi:RNA polymerase sigma-70 factor (ECF subfamily)